MFNAKIQLEKGAEYYGDLTPFENAVKL